MATNQSVYSPPLAEHKEDKLHDVDHVEDAEDTARQTLAARNRNVQAK